MKTILKFTLMLLVFASIKLKYKKTPNYVHKRFRTEIVLFLFLSSLFTKQP